MRGASFLALLLVVVGLSMLVIGFRGRGSQFLAALKK